MRWPKIPTCHSRHRQPMAVQDEAARNNEWTILGSVRHCRYCGSVHPEDLIVSIENYGMELEGADWKYGWPHKFYLHGAPFRYPIKWYNEHILDEGYDEEALMSLLSIIERESDVHFEVYVDSDEKRRLMYRAPYHGYQHPTKDFRKYLEEMEKSRQGDYDSGEEDGGPAQPPS